MEQDEDKEASLMLDETDKEALEAELWEDEALDKEDAKKVEKYEEDLWAEAFEGPCVDNDNYDQ